MIVPSYEPLDPAIPEAPSIVILSVSESVNYYIGLSQLLYRVECLSLAA